METPAFLTGSQVYGLPTSESDIDLVVFGNEKLVADLRELMFDKESANWQRECDKHISYAPFRFGRLNLVIVDNYDEYMAWKLTTKALAKDKPVDKETCVKAHEWLRKGLIEINLDIK